MYFVARLEGDDDWRLQPQDAAGSPRLRVERRPIGGGIGLQRDNRLAGGHASKKRRKRHLVWGPRERDDDVGLANDAFRRLSGDQFDVSAGGASARHRFDDRIEAMIPVRQLRLKSKRPD